MQAEKADHENETGITTPFKQAQLRHRRRGDDPNRMDDMEEWVDFSRVRPDDQRIIQLELPRMLPSGLRIYRGPIFGLRDFPGFLFAPQALAYDVQIELAYRAVTEYCEKPHITNIDQCPPKPNEVVDESMTMWCQWKEASKANKSTATKKAKRTQANAQRHYRSFKKLAWATMGYHYDWTERSYNENLKSDMPALVEDLSTLFAMTSLLLEKQNQKQKQSTNLSFAPTASIVNFYTTKSIMGGHRDDLELAIDKPIVSMSTGLPALFLLGGPTKDDKPVVPILIRSGDVMCMGGDSRLNYHGMARLIPSSALIPPLEIPSCPSNEYRIALKDMRHEPSFISEEDTEALDNFLSDHRININVRQVYSDDGGRVETGTK